MVWPTHLWPTKPDAQMEQIGHFGPQFASALAFAGLRSTSPSCLSEANVFLELISRSWSKSAVRAYRSKVDRSPAAHARSGRLSAWIEDFGLKGIVTRNGIKAKTLSVCPRCRSSGFAKC